MSASELYDFLTTIAPDYNYTLAIKAQGKVTEEGGKNQVIRTGDDGSEERITLSSTSIFFVSFAWNQLTEANSGTIFDLYHDSAKANGQGNSFKLAAWDGHTYVVRFACKLSRTGNAVSRWGLPGIKMRILGRIAD